MLETYFSAPKTLRRLRSGISGPYIDAFADDLERDGYAPSIAVRSIRAAAHLGCFVQRRGFALADIDFNILHALATICAVANALISSDQKSVFTHLLARNFSIDACSGK